MKQKKKNLTEETAYASKMVNVSVNEVRVELSRTERPGQNVWTFRSLKLRLFK